MAVLEEGLKSHPNDRETLQALISFNQMAGDTKAALGFAERLAVTAPNDQGLAALIRDLRRAVKSSAQ